jgi:HSP20 family protein
MSRNPDNFVKEFDNFLNNPLDAFNAAYKHLDKFARVLDESFELGHSIRIPVDLIDEDDHYKAVMDIPGVLKQDIVIETVERPHKSLSIKASRMNEINMKNKTYMCQERHTKMYERILPLPYDADMDSINADYENGLLILSISKKINVQQVGKRVQVN